MDIVDKYYKDVVVLYRTIGVTTHEIQYLSFVIKNDKYLSQVFEDVDFYEVAKEFISKYKQTNYHRKPMTSIKDMIDEITIPEIAKFYFYGEPNEFGHSIEVGSVTKDKYESSHNVKIVLECPHCGKIHKIIQENLSLLEEHAIKGYIEVPCRECGCLFSIIFEQESEWDNQ